MACVVRSIGRVAERPSFAYFARVLADRAEIAFWRCCSGLVAVAAASRTRATSRRLAGAVQRSRFQRLFEWLAPLVLRAGPGSVMVALAMGRAPPRALHSFCRLP